MVPDLQGPHDVTGRGLLRRRVTSFKAKSAISPVLLILPPCILRLFQWGEEEKQGESKRDMRKDVATAFLVVAVCAMIFLFMPPSELEKCSGRGAVQALFWPCAK